MLLLWIVVGRLAEGRPREGEPGEVLGNVLDLLGG
jgi:hypothetical protein